LPVMDISYKCWPFVSGFFPPVFKADLWCSMCEYSFFFFLFKRGRIYFSSQFQRLLFMVICLCHCGLVVRHHSIITAESVMEESFEPHGSQEAEKVLSPFLWLNNIQFHGYTTFCLFILPLMNCLFGLFPVFVYYE
jgi:hypothetical protein